MFSFINLENLGTMSVSSGTGVTPAIYKKVIRKILQATDPSRSSILVT